MALTSLLFAALLAVLLENGLTSITSPPMISKPLLADTKRRNDLVDETFLEQKDVLLDMLETKLKEVQNKKKKKADRSENMVESVRCDNLPSNVDLRLKANGLSAVGEAEVALKFGKAGKGTLNLEASGISNVGKARLDLGVNDGGIHVPGLNNLFLGKSFYDCNKELPAKPLPVIETIPPRENLQVLGIDSPNYRRNEPSEIKVIENDATVTSANDTQSTGNVTTPVGPSVLANSSISSNDTTTVTTAILPQNVTTVAPNTTTTTTAKA